MALYGYLKENPSQRFFKPEKERFLTYRRKKIFAAIFLVAGFALILAVIFPLVNYQFFYAPKFSYILSPIPEEFRNNEISLGVAAQEDYTNINTWFKQTEEIKSPNEEFSSVSYLLSIPKLGIKDANVIINSQDLSKNLVQYPQTALPGQLGNTVILGHSVLPQFFNPKNYLTIFSLLYQMDIGDQILINFDGVEYSYRVEEIFEVKPTDLSPLRQRFDNRFLTLITCSPPGTYLRRLIVRARLEN
jgi:sortase A